MKRCVGAAGRDGELRGMLLLPPACLRKQGVAEATAQVSEESISGLPGVRGASA